MQPVTTATEHPETITHWHELKLATSYVDIPLIKHSYSILVNGLDHVFNYVAITS